MKYANDFLEKYRTARFFSNRLGFSSISHFYLLTLKSFAFKLEASSQKIIFFFFFFENR